MVRKKNCPNCGSRKITPKGLSIDRKVKDGSATSVGLNFQERVEEEHPKKDKRQW